MLCAASSPSTNPSSCDSQVCSNREICSNQPSTSEGNQMEPCQMAGNKFSSELSSEVGSHSSSSPAVARSVPPHQEPHYPESTGPFVYFTTELANKAALEYEKEKFDSLVEWHRRYHERLDREKEVSVKSEGSTVLNESPDTNKENTEERKPLKRKIEDSPEAIFEPDPKKPILDGEPEQEEKPVYLDIGATGQKKEDVNPLRRMEMMTNSSAFNASSSITEVVVDPKKDDRSAKLDKLGGIEKDLNAEQQARNMQQQHMWQQQQHMERLRQQQGQPENGAVPPMGPSPQMGPGPMGAGPYPPFPPPGAFPPNPMSAGSYPSPHFPGPGMPPFPFPHLQGPPTSTTAKGSRGGKTSAKNSPGAFPPGFKPGMMSPHQMAHMQHMMHMQQMAARGMVPQPGRSPSFPGFPMAGQPNPFPGMPNYPNPMFPHPGQMMGPMSGPMPNMGPGITGPMSCPTSNGPMSGPQGQPCGGPPMGMTMNGGPPRNGPMSGPNPMGPSVPGSTNGMPSCGPMSGPMLAQPPNSAPNGPHSAPGVNKPMMSPYPGPGGMMPSPAHPGIMPNPAQSSASGMPGGMLMVSRGGGPGAPGGSMEPPGSWPAQFCDPNALPGFSQPYPQQQQQPAVSSCQVLS